MGVKSGIGASSNEDRATRPTAQAPTGLGDTASIPCADMLLAATISLRSYTDTHGKAHDVTVAFASREEAEGFAEWLEQMLSTALGKEVK